MRRRTTAERSRINGRIEWSAPHLEEDRRTEDGGRRTEDSEAAEGEEDAEGRGSERRKGDVVGGERGIQEEEGGGQDEEGERSNTLSSPVHTLAVTSTGKVLLAFVKVHRRLSGSSAPLVRPKPASSREKKPPKSPEPKI